MNAHASPVRSDEFITIIGASMAEIIDEYNAQGLAQQHFSILHRVGPHRFTKCGPDGSHALFGGETLVAATFRRQPA